jgi:hypothetical protein
MENHPLHDQFVAYAEERSLLRELVAQYNILMDNYELQPDNHSKKALKDFLQRFPGIPNYDEKGNWIGSVRNENGWTA